LDSASLTEYGFREWHKLSAIKTGSTSLPHKPGTYVLRLNRHFERLKGKSDILYIGCTEKGGTLNSRIGGFLRGTGGDDRTAKRIRRNLVERGYLNHVEVSWVTTDSREKARTLEKHLLRQYEEDHEELPPWNRSM